MSLYLLSFELKGFREILHKNFLLPRYFSFAVILFFIVKSFHEELPNQTLVWKIPRFWQSLSCLIAIEIAALFSPQLASLNTLTRVGGGLVLSLLTPPPRLSVRVLLKSFFPWFGILLVGCWIPVAIADAGITDLAFVICDPRVHPNSLAFSTFVAAIVTGAVTGSFSLTFFTLMNIVAKFGDDPLIRSALLDGLIAGTFLSPFSLFNLIPLSQFGLSVQDLLGMRLKQLGYPILMTALIYGVSTLNTVSILRPLVFLFLILIAIALQLKRSDWMLSKPALGSEA